MLLFEGDRISLRDNEELGVQTPHLDRNTVEVMDGVTLGTKLSNRDTTVGE